MFWHSSALCALTWPSLHQRSYTTLHYHGLDQWNILSISKCIYRYTIRDLRRVDSLKLLTEIEIGVQTFITPGCKRWCNTGFFFHVVQGTATPTLAAQCEKGLRVNAEILSAEPQESVLIGRKVHSYKQSSCLRYLGAAFWALMYVHNYVEHFIDWSL